MGSQQYCPVCGEAMDPGKSPVDPFCSPRCQLVDLGRWLGEKYCVPVERLDEVGPADGSPEWE